MDPLLVLEPHGERQQHLNDDNDDNVNNNNVNNDNNNVNSNNVNNDNNNVNNDNNNVNNINNNVTKVKYLLAVIMSESCIILRTKSGQAAYSDAKYITKSDAFARESCRPYLGRGLQAVLEGGVHAGGRVPTDRRPDEVDQVDDKDEEADDLS